MPADKFLPPAYSTTPNDKDPRIVRVNEDYAEIGSRSATMPKPGKNDMTIRHVNTK